MAKKPTVAKKPTISEEGLLGLKLTMEPNDFLKHCVRSVANSDMIGGSRPYFQEIQTVHGSLFAFACESSARVYNEKSILIPTTVVGEVLGIHFWLALTIRIDSNLGSSYLNHVSVKILKSASIGESQELISRAEWDFRITSNPKFSHAQPHWHFHTRPSETPPASFAQYSAASEVGTEATGFLGFIQRVSEISEKSGSIVQPTRTKPKILDFSKIHLAMASTWHLNFEHRPTLTNDIEICYWLQNCLTYIRDQLAYLSDKLVHE